MSNNLSIVPVFQKEAFEFVSKFHRHHKKPVGSIFQIGISDGTDLIGVVIVGRPLSRNLQDGFTVEVTRLCVKDGYKNACSMLYGSAWRVAKNMGYKKMITYILKTESGGSLKASGWVLVGEKGGGSWNRLNRMRLDKHPTQKKYYFKKTLKMNKALSILQPWAHLVAMGVKKYETRSWKTELRGKIYIHASKGLSPGKLVLHQPPFKTFMANQDPQYGAIIGEANIDYISTVEAIKGKISRDELMMGDYTQGRYAWHLTGAILYPKPYFCKGALNLWDVTEEQMEEISRVKFFR